MLKVNLEYEFKQDLSFIMEAEKQSILDLTESLNISRMTLEKIKNNEPVNDDVMEKLYCYIYDKKYRLNKIKEELLKETYPLVLFHGSKFGLNDISPIGARNNCDFGNGFYLGETYEQALAFTYDKPKSSVYAFKADISNLKIKKLTYDLQWMLTICYYRGSLKKYENHPLMQKCIKEIEDADVIISPIADNKMFHIMSQFADGDINADVAIHSLSASNLGMQYIFKSEKALNALTPLKKLYICEFERKNMQNKLNERAYEIDTKLKLAKREYKNGLYIEEILK